MTLGRSYYLDSILRGIIKMNTNRLQHNGEIPRYLKMMFLHGAAPASNEQAKPEFATHMLVGIVLVLCALAIPAQAGDTLQVALRWCVVGNDANGNKHWDPG